MASALASAHIEAERRLRELATRTTERIWRSLPGYDRADLDRWLSLVLPVIATGQRASAALTDAYLARALDRAPLGLDPDQLTGAAVRNGTDPAEVYERPFVTVWTALSAGTAYEDAVAAGLARAKGAAAMDMQLSMRATANTVERSDPAMYGFQRVADAGACEFCAAIDGAYVKFADAMPLHNFCGCGLEPLTESHSLAATLPSGVAVHRHGELGAVLGDPAHSFTGPSDL